MARNSEVIKIINNVDVTVLLIDSLEGITRQDFRLADLALSKHKILFFVSEVDILEDKRKYQLNIKKHLRNNYSKHKLINIDFISAKNNTRISNVLKQIILKKN